MGLGVVVVKVWSVKMLLLLLVGVAMGSQLIFHILLEVLEELY